jgi:hypothetical protein
MDLQRVAGQIDDPAFRDAGARVETGLVLAIDAVRRVGRLDDERGTGGMPFPVVAGRAGRHRGVGLGLGVVVETGRAASKQCV